MTGNVNIPLNKLTQYEGNVRKTQDKGFIAKLAASIDAHGLQQNLVVMPQGKKYAVVAGGQRLAAYWQLLKAGKVKASHPIPCKIKTGDFDPAEISLLENVLRENMHPADQFEAFRDLVDKGVPVPDIAARFSVSDTVVLQRLKLARVSPAVLKSYRDTRLTLEQVMAFAVSDDHAAQEHVLENLHPNDRGQRSIRDALTENEIAASDRRVKFVTLAAYEKAGGKTRRDLFSEGAESVFLLDAALLDRLVTAKLERAAKPLATEGWKWIEILPAFSYEQRTQLRRIHAEPAPLPLKLAREAEALEKERETLIEKWEAAEDDSEEPERIGKIDKRLEAIEDKRGDAVWTPAQLSMAGVVVTITDDGKTYIERGLVRPEDMPKKSGKPAKGNAPDGAETEEGRVSELSAALVESLTAQKSAALAAELQQRPDVALAAVVHAFASRVLRNSSEDSSLQVSAAPQSLRRVEGSKALAQIEKSREEWNRVLPDADGLMAWCLKQDQTMLLKLLAFCAGTTINAVRLKSDKQGAERFLHADRLTAALGLDMKAWFTTDAANYFSRVSKPQILDAIKEVKQQPPAPAWEKLKKADLAQEAERQLSCSGWLPKLLRSEL